VGDFDFRYMSVSPNKQKPGRSVFTPRNTLATKTLPPSTQVISTSSYQRSPESIGDSTGLFDSSPLVIVGENITSSAPMDNQENVSKSKGNNTSNSQPQTQQHASSQPEAQRKNPLGSKFSSLFNIPKRGVARPEHHRQPPSASSSRNVSGSSTLDDSAWMSNPTNPWTQNSSAQNKILSGTSSGWKRPPEIPRFDPTGGAKYAQPPSAKPLFSSFGTPFNNPVSVPQSAPQRVTIDLTDEDNQFDPNAALKDRSFNAYEYVDPIKANENLKKLLEGAFEDEEEEGERKQRLPKSVRKPAAKVAKKVGGIKSLADRLMKLEVKEEAAEEVPGEEEDDDEGYVDGLEVRLLPHQIDGVSWMIERESGKKKKGIFPKGGILADDMGLGKTIQALSLILMNFRPSDEQLEKEFKKKKIPISTSHSTLVVAPLALIKQWESEIKTKAPGLKVLVHHGPSRTTMASKLKAYDVVVTTYQTLMSEHTSEATGCFGVQWYRVILDEAHSIKNPKAKSTQATYALRSIYRWCLTGTPMQNNLDELQSLIRFLRIQPYCDYSSWKRDITGPIKDGRGGIGMRRLHYFLKAFMMRRTKDVLRKEGGLGHQTAEGGGFKLVGREVREIKSEFDASERLFYERLESRAQESLDVMMKKDKNNYIGALVLLLRLRQACNHPHLMKSKMEKDQDALAVGTSGRGQQQKGDSDVDGLANLLDGLSVQTKNCDMCKRQFDQNEVSRGSIRCNDCEADLAIATGTSRKLKPKTKKSEKSKKTKKSKISSEERQKLRKARQRRVVIDSDDEDEASAEWLVSQESRNAKDGELNTDDEDDEEGAEWLGSDDSETDDEEDDDAADQSGEEETERSLHYNPYKPMNFSPDTYDGELPASTKIKEMLSILETETPDNKVIVFSQFTTMLDIIEPFLEEAGHRYVRYDGSMRNDQREHSLNQLRTNSKTRVLLCSLRCGSLGLNLTAASRVIIMEPFWNPVSFFL
jgi:SNF2 family DNA or RNA helicase